MNARRWMLPVVAALLVAVGLLGWWQWYDTRAEARENVAVVDASATKEVQAQVGQALTRVLSFSHDDPGATVAAADQVLTGQARDEFDRLFADLQESAKGQDLVLSATVQAAGVKELDDSTASLLVFVDQSSQRAEDDEASISAAQLAVTAKKVGATWTITTMDVL